MTLYLKGDLPHPEVPCSDQHLTLFVFGILASPMGHFSTGGIWSQGGSLQCIHANMSWFWHKNSVSCYALSPFPILTTWLGLLGSIWTSISSWIGPKVDSSSYKQGSMFVSISHLLVFSTSMVWGRFSLFLASSSDLLWHSLESYCLPRTWPIPAAVGNFIVM